MKKRLLSILMLCCLAASLLPMSVLAVGPEQETALPQEDLFYQYMLQRAREEQGGTVSLASTGDHMAGSNLTGQNKMIYDILAKDIIDVADGKTISTEFAVTGTDLGLTETRYSASDLGVDAIVVDGAVPANVTAALLQKELTFDRSMSAFLDALCADFPQDLYWYDIEMGCYMSLRYSYTTYGNDLIALSAMDTVVSFTFAVANDYSNGVYKALGGKNYNCEVDGAKITAANTAVNNALDIVARHEDESDYQKLAAYKDVICDLVDYNTPATKPDYDRGYGDPWQLVYVFDEYDPVTGGPKSKETNVVCEGYSKAFQYLCDLSTFESDIVQCYTVSGLMDGGTGAGGHMWNLVVMPDGLSYLVDITNVDEGSVGNPDYLFLKGVTWDTDSQCHITVAKPGYVTATVYYVYYSNMSRLWAKEDGILTCSTEDYGECRATFDAGSGKFGEEATAPNTMEKTYYYNNLNTTLPLPGWGANQFDGWFAKSLAGEDIKVNPGPETGGPGDIRAGGPFDDPTQVVDTLNLTAHWSCAVSFVPGEGAEITSGNASRYVPCGEAIIIVTTPDGPQRQPLPEVSRTGFEPAGWFDEDGNKVDETTVVTDAMTLTAGWKFETELKVGDGTLNLPTPVMVVEGLPLLDQLPTDKTDDPATVPGVTPPLYHELAGWSTDKEGKNLIDQDTIANGANHRVLYAQWEFVGYKYQLDFLNCDGATLTFVSEDGSRVPFTSPISELKDTPTCTFGLASYSAAREGETFLGWTTVKNDATTLVTSYKLENDTPGSLAEGTVYALWVKDSVPKDGMSIPNPDDSAKMQTVTCYCQNGKATVIGSGLSASAPSVLLACYDTDGKMLFVTFVDMSKSTEKNAAVVDLAEGTARVKLFWPGSTGFPPLCRNADINLAAEA